MDKFDTSEIINPKKTLVRREAQAQNPPAPAPAKGDMTQSEFTSGGPSIRKKDEAARQKKFQELMRKHQAN